MNEQQFDAMTQDLRRGAAILSAGGSNWEMVKNPEPILYVLARRVVSSANAWIPGPDLVEDLVALKREDTGNFNPHGWFAKELTEFERDPGRERISSAINRWAPHIGCSCSIRSAVCKWFPEKPVRAMRIVEAT